MTCAQAKSLIDPYADGELDPAGILDLERMWQINVAGTARAGDRLGTA